jgi:hypothetical protein
MRYFEKRKLIKFRNNLENNNVNYLKHHKRRIEWLDWLISSYEGRTGDGKRLLESLMRTNLGFYDDYVIEMKRIKVVPISEATWLKDLIMQIDFLYQWIYYKKITGF